MSLGQRMRFRSPFNEATNTYGPASIVLTSGVGNNSVYTATWDVFSETGAFIESRSGTYTSISPVDLGGGVTGAQATAVNWPQNAIPPRGHDISTYAARPAPLPHTVFNGQTQWSGAVGWDNFAWSSTPPPLQSTGSWAIYTP